MSGEEWEEIGAFGVDSGTFVICDPCYLEDKKHVKQILLANHQMREENAKEGTVVFPGKKESEGLAFISDTLIGDGYFYIYKRIREDGFKEVKIVFEP